MPHVENAAAGLAHDGKRLGQQVVDGLAVSEPGSEFRGLALELIVAQGLDPGFEFVDLGYARAQLLQVAIVLTAEDFGEELAKHDGKKAGCLSPDYTRLRQGCGAASLLARSVGLASLVGLGPL